MLIKTESGCLINADRITQVKLIVAVKESKTYYEVSAAVNAISSTPNKYGYFYPIGDWFTLKSFDSEQDANAYLDSLAGEGVGTRNQKRDSGASCADR